MKTILIIFLLGLTFSYDGTGAANYAQKYCNNYNPEYKKYSDQNEENVNFVSQCIGIGGGQDFEGCEGKDDKGMFTKGSDLKNCLISKGWKSAFNPKKGTVAFRIFDSSEVKIITNDKCDLLNRATFCSHTPDRCDEKQNCLTLLFYSP